jgi:hypothetical protein
MSSLGSALADRNDLDFTYSLIDRIFCLSLGELADFSGAKYGAAGAALVVSIASAGSVHGLIAGWNVAALASAGLCAGGVAIVRARRRAGTAA